jgi:hypothetical protein
MRRVSLTLRGVVRAEDESEADRLVRSVLTAAGIKIFGLEVETEDLGPVQATTVEPESMVQHMTAI